MQEVEGNLLEEKPEKLSGATDQQSDPDKHRYAEDQKYEGRRLQGSRGSDYLSIKIQAWRRAIDHLFVEVDRAYPGWGKHSDPVRPGRG